MALYKNDNGNLSLIAGGTLYADAPIGAIQAFGGSVAPSGWLLCQGQAISRTTYADLFAVIGTNFGVGDGSTTFNLPDLEGKVAAGYKSNETEFNEIGKTGGEKAHTLTVTEMPTHTHPNTSLNVSSTQFIQGGNIGNWVANTANSGSAGGGGAHNNLQPYVVTNYIIKAQMVSVPADFLDSVHTLDTDFNCYYTKNNNTVTIQLFRLDYSSAATTINIGTLPNGYRPKVNTRVTNGASQDPTAFKGNLVIGTNGNVAVNLSTTGAVNLAFSATFIVD